MLATAQTAKASKQSTAAALATYFTLGFRRDICSDLLALAELIEQRGE